jgi:undecaprenyl-diphosphatase
MHSSLALFSWLTDKILSLQGPPAIALIFLLPALEASAFVGFIFPGEIAILLGGVLAANGSVPLPAALEAAILGAFLGDAVGYAIGNRWGRQVIHGSLGRLPIIKHDLHKHLNSAEAFLERKGGAAVFLGRFTVALRVLIPGLAGMSKLRYRKFAFYNALGAIVWGGGFVMLGYLAGNAWKRVEADAKWLGIALLALIIVGFIADRVLRKRAGRPKIDLEAEMEEGEDQAVAQDEERTGATPG